MAKKTITYNEAMSKIEEVIAEIEGGELDVDVLSQKVKRVAELIEICKNKLHKTESEVEEILKGLKDA